mmetsp:Transcript_173376/g.421681  ORF Transcript_173376/g.421681 Transcript_173376/m.421681 type:complete len:234 (-) Transcript_173376:101-802(-)
MVIAHTKAVVSAIKTLPFKMPGLPRAPDRLTQRSQSVSEGDRCERLLDKRRLPLLDLGLRCLHLGLHVGLELGPDLRRLQVAVGSGAPQLGLDGRLGLLAVLRHGLGGLLAGHADLLRVLDLDLVRLRQVVRRLRKCLEELGIPVVHLCRYGAVPERIENSHHREERECHEGQSKAEIEHTSSMRWLRHTCQQHSVAGSYKRGSSGNGGLRCGSCRSSKEGQAVCEEQRETCH